MGWPNPIFLLIFLYFALGPKNGSLPGRRGCNYRQRSVLTKLGFLCVHCLSGWSPLDDPIRANRFADSRESPDSRESFQGSRTEPLFFANRASGAKNLRITMFEAICANRFERYESYCRFFSANRFARIDSRESPRFALRTAGPSKVKTFIPATEPLDPRRVSEEFQKGSLKGSLKGFRRGQSRTLQNPSNAFKNPSKTLQEGVDIDGALGFPGL